VIINTPGQAQRPGHDSEFFVSAPLICKALSAPEHVTGVLNITDRQDARPFTPLELEHIDLICNIAAYVIDDLVTRRARDEARDSIAAALAKLAEYRDTDTGLHLDRVSGFAVILAEDLRETEQFRDVIDDPFLSELSRAVPLHDIGKVATPDHILLKPGKLTPEEMAVMRMHPVVGMETIRALVKRTPGTHFLEMAEEIAYAHHEWYDGSGYPRGLAAEEIPLAARIAALADVYDALTTKRPYKDAMPHEQAMRIIREMRGSQFDPAVVDAFLRREQAFADLASQLADEASTPSGSTADRPGGAALVATR
jgi:putative two-component system response regulator